MSPDDVGSRHVVVFTQFAQPFVDTTQIDRSVVRSRRVGVLIVFGLTFAGHALDGLTQAHLAGPALLTGGSAGSEGSVVAPPARRLVGQAVAVALSYDLIYGLADYQIAQCFSRSSIPPAGGSGAAGPENFFFASLWRLCRHNDAKNPRMGSARRILDRQSRNQPIGIVSRREREAAGLHRNAYPLC